MTTSLYFTYDGLLDPLGQSQILPYILNLKNNGYKLVIISYEKSNQLQNIEILSKKLSKEGIYWKPLIFRKGKIFFFQRIFMGIIWIHLLNIRKKVDLVHLRGGYSGLIYFISLCRTKYLYDLRAFWGQWADGGRTNYDSLTYRLLIKLENCLINRASGIIVLDKSGEEFLKKSFNFKKPLFVIPTATNIKKYKLKKKSNKKTINFVYLGGARFPPYRISDAISLIKHLNNYGLNCKIDFINNNEHFIIDQIIKKENFDKKFYSIFSLSHEEIFDRLPYYDIGLVFLNTGKWIRMSSPTKIGEYLGAGLCIISNKGIAVLDRLSKQSKCVETIDINSKKVNYSKKRINYLLEKVKDFQNKKESQQLALKYYSLEKANEKYLKIYNILLNN